jgi:signal transduction histidine kinase
MSALGKLFRTTAFKLSLLYLVVFALFASFLLGYLAWNTRRLITTQITETIDAELLGLADQYRLAGLRRLVAIVDARARRPGSSLYLVATAAGDGLVGNIVPLDGNVLERPGWAEITYRRLDDPQGLSQFALARIVHLTGGFRLLVGRDLDERERLNQIVWAAAQWSFALVIVLGLAGGFFIARRVLKRVDAMSDTAQTIMTGDLSGRLAVAGTGDELDRLAVSFNNMLERIEALMHGMKEVSDNIAHDLKTPLTRLRNRCEAALRTAQTQAEHRAALEATIEESDRLIHTFNALLMIARAESGHARELMGAFDAAEVARDVGELYEPVAEDADLALTVEAGPIAQLKGSRELVSQALANLVDNAIKYAAPEPEQVSEGSRRITVSARDTGDEVLLSVADNGPGIPEADRQRAVERFVRLETSRTKPGSGLGLSLAAAVARLHGGVLRLEDNGPGLRAVLALPRQEVRDQAEAARP